MLKLTKKRSDWFTFPQDESGQSKVKIQHLKPGEIADISAACNQLTGKGVDGEEMQTEITFGLRDQTKKLICKAIIDWKGFEGVNGKELPCNDVNKLAVLKEFDWFEKQIDDFRQQLAEVVNSEEEGAEKN